MADINSLPRFFLSANSGNGFISHFSSSYDSKDDWRAYIIKGGPGTGKSTTMKYIAKEISDIGLQVEISPCTGDPASVDAVIFPQIKTIIMDGTAPHVVEPKFVGACETIVNFGDSFDVKKLQKNREQIQQISENISFLYERAYGYLHAAYLFSNDTRKLAMQCTDFSKVVRFAEKIANKYISDTKKGMGRESIRFLSATTCCGNIFFYDTLDKLCDNIIMINDEYGAVSKLFMDEIHRISLARGYNIITCPCSIAPKEKIDHIIIPEIKVAFSTCNKYLQHDISLQRINSRRFTDVAELRARRQRITFNKRASKDIMNGVYKIMAETKILHDELEKYYISAVDFDIVEKIKEKLIKSIVDSIKI